MNITLSNREEATLLLILAVHGPLRKLPQHDFGFLLQVLCGSLLDELRSGVNLSLMVSYRFD